MIGIVDDDADVLRLRDDILAAADSAEAGLRRQAQDLTGVLQAKRSAPPGATAQLDATAALMRRQITRRRRRLRRVGVGGERGGRRVPRAGRARRAEWRSAADRATPAWRRCGRRAAELHRPTPRAGSGDAGTDPGLTANLHVARSPPVGWAAPGEPLPASWVARNRPLTRRRLLELGAETCWRPNHMTGAECCRVLVVGRRARQVAAVSGGQCSERSSVRDADPLRRGMVRHGSSPIQPSVSRSSARRSPSDPATAGRANGSGGRGTPAVVPCCALAGSPGR